VNRRQFLRTTAGAGVVAGALAGCIADPDTPTEEGGGGENTVLMAQEGDQYFFDPVGLFVESGTAVTWENGQGSHSATAYQEGTGGASVTRIPESAEAFNSGTISEEGATFEHTFETAGTYDYFCIPHKALGMVARIVVGEPGGPATEGSPPDGDVPSSEAIVDQGSISHEEFSG
jgi:plastocyanin